jgi:uncharacterized protein (DUF58 family)
VRQTGAAHSTRTRSFSPAFPWITPRFIAAAAAIALVYAAGYFIPALTIVGIVLAAGLIGFAFADWFMGPRRSEIRVERQPLEHLSLRNHARLGYTVANTSSAGVRFTIVDSPCTLLTLPEAPLAGIAGAGRRATVSQPILPIERGESTLGPLYVSAENGLGLLRRRWIVEAGTPVRVFPDLSAVERYGMLARRGRLVEAGFRKLRLRGGGGEFDSLREWMPDDEFRAIDWKATARRGKLMVAQYDVERSQNVMLVLDAGRLMTPRIGLQRKFDYSVTAALSVAAIAGYADDKVGLLAFSRDIIEHVAPRSGAQHATGLTARIFDLQPRFEESDYERAFAYLRRTQPKRSLVIVFTDMFDPVAQATVLANMSVLTPRHLVVCVLMNDEAVESALLQQPATLHDAYRASVASNLLAARRKACATLVRAGVAVIDVPAAMLTVSMINAYVEVKSRALL